MAALKTGPAPKLADQLLKLVDYGESKKPPPDSVLAQAVASARAYAAYLVNDVWPELGGVVIVESTNIFATADALAQMIIDEGTSGAYGDPSPPPELDGLPWVPMAAAAGILGVLAFLASRNGRRGVLAAVGL